MKEPRTCRGSSQAPGTGINELIISRKFHFFFNIYFTRHLVISFQHFKNGCVAAGFQPECPPDNNYDTNGVKVQIFENQAQAYHNRMMLLVENALTGLVLVLGVLWLFLTPPG
ncbi:hypothetical protein [uncultured Desulfobacter sp.]|uniref:hypothetical protein n=1 Tax=uncultured Desulfobacter sp. TaxID=240139 RepID=UPI002AA689DF|nr:hypothetical protein [uncultured Desulfobacter sp.]